MDEADVLFSEGILQEGCHQEPESAAWEFIRKLSLDAILSVMPPRVVQSVKPALKSHFQACCLVALRKICEKQDETAWNLFYLIPRMVLELTSRGGKSGLKEVKTVFDKFLEWRWEELVHLSKARIPRKQSLSDNQSKQAALRLV